MPPPPKRKLSVLALVNASGSTGTTAKEIRSAMNLSLEHERCIVAHALTRLHNAGAIQRSKSPDVHFNSFRYYPAASNMNAKDHIKEIIHAKPGISSKEIGELLTKAIGRKGNHSTHLSQMYKRGSVRREMVNAGQPGFETYHYWLADQKSDVAPVIERHAPEPEATTSPAVFATFSDGRAIVETSAARIELTAAEATKFRSMLNAAATV